MTYAERVRQLESEGLSTSDAQAIADAELAHNPRAFDFDAENPADSMPRAALIHAFGLETEADLEEKP